MFYYECECGDDHQADPQLNRPQHARCEHISLSLSLVIALPSTTTFYWWEKLSQTTMLRSTIGRLICLDWSHYHQLVVITVHLYYLHHHPASFSFISSLFLYSKQVRHKFVFGFYIFCWLKHWKKEREAEHVMRPTMFRVYLYILCASCLII